MGEKNPIANHEPVIDNANPLENFQKFIDHVRDGWIAPSKKKVARVSRSQWKPLTTAPAVSGSRFNVLDVEESSPAASDEAPARMLVPAAAATKWGSDVGPCQAPPQADIADETELQSPAEQAAEERAGCHRQPHSILDQKPIGSSVGRWR